MDIYQFIAYAIVGLFQTMLKFIFDLIYGLFLQGLIIPLISVSYGTLLQAIDYIWMAARNWYWKP